MNEEIKTYRLIIKGKVQNVGFRHWFSDLAISLGLNGYVQNNLNNDEVASILLQGMTVEYLFERLYKIKKDEFILFHAAAGGVGLIACQWARSLGCKIIGTVSNKEKEDLALKHGCQYVINYKEESVHEKVMEITSGQGVPVVYDGVGKDTFDDSIKSLSTRGLMVSFGQSSGMV